MKKGLSLWICLAAFLGFGSAFSQGVITGLIIDARELSFIPPAALKVLDEEGRELYGSAYISKEWFEKQGMAGYAKTLEDAKANPRVAGNPLVVKAIKSSGPNKGDLVLSDADARKIRELAKNMNFLDHGKIMVVVP